MKLELQAEKRKELGKKVKQLRKKGLLPGVVYGAGATPEAVSVPMIEFQRVYRAAGESTVVVLNVVDEKKKSVTYNTIIHGVSFDPLRDTPLHADFLNVRMDQVIRAHVEIAFVGESSAVKEDGAVLVRTMSEIEVEALPGDLPHTLEADLSMLAHIDDKILVSDIVVPTGVKVITGGDEVVAIAAAQNAEEVSVVPEGATTEVKTEREVKLAERSKDKEEEE